jgi:hypothetical protein
MIFCCTASMFMVFQIQDAKALASAQIQSRHSLCVRDSNRAQTRSLLYTKKYDIQTHHLVM